MSDSYIRKFMPNRKHIISFVFIIISVLLFLSGFYRAYRISGRHTMIEFTFDYQIHKNDSILLSLRPFETRLKEAENDTVVIWGQMGSLNPVKDYQMFMIKLAGKYRPVMVTMNTEEYDKFLNGEEVTGYFTEKNFNDFPDFVLNMHNYYELENKITDKDYSKLGIVIVDRQKELLSFMWGIPFLVIGLILFKIAGSVFFYVPETTDK
ncbi:MAG: hypothetical protein K2J32_02890 [Ruminococcus sp.]|nr:hypothetical protein [Ruminococcus sp.]